MRLWIVLFILFTSTLHAQYKDGIVVIQYTADFVKAADQTPVDHEQIMLIEFLSTQLEKIQEGME